MASLMVVLVQAITLADLCYLHRGSVVFEKLGLGDLEKRPNIKRQGVCPNLDFRDT